MKQIFEALDTQHKMLFALNARATRTGAPIFSGIDPADKARNRAAGKVARHSRRANRGR